MLTLSHLLRIATSPVTRLVSKNAFHSSAIMPSKVAVVLSGCGVYDGAEVHEASAILVHLSRSDAKVSMFAPDKDQYHVINHTKGEPQDQKRNVLVEAARIARGNITNLKELKADGYDAVIFPGGFGVAKNLSTFVDEGANCSVNPDVERVLKEFHSAKKPIGLCCIAPVLAARVLTGCTVTVGSDKEEDGRWPYAGTVEAIKNCGSKHSIKDVTETCVDEENKIVTTPAFMCETAVHHIHDGIGNMIKDVLKLVKK